jgi:hypothetical protein
MKCSHETILTDHRVVSTLVALNEPEHYHRQSFVYYEHDSGKHPLAQFDCTTKRTSASAKFNIEVEFHMKHVFDAFQDYVSMCAFFSRISEIVDPYMHYTPERPLKCGLISYQVKKRQLPISLLKHHSTTLQTHSYAATPKFDGIRQYIIFDTRGIFSATTSDPPEVRPICNGRLSDDIKDAKTGELTPNNTIVLDTEHMTDGTYHVFDVISDTVYKTHEKPLSDRMKFVISICKEYETTIMAHSRSAPGIIPKQMIFDSLSCAVDVIHNQYLNGAYKIDGIIFVPTDGSYEHLCDNNRPNPVLKFKPLRLLTIDFGINLKELGDRSEAEKPKTTVQMSNGKGHSHIRGVLPNYLFNWIDMYSLLRTVDISVYNDSKLCIVECQVVLHSDGAHINPMRIREDKEHANSWRVVESNLMSIRELTNAESEIKQRGDMSELDDLSVMQYWLKGAQYTPSKMGGGDVLQLDGEIFSSINSNNRILFISPRNVFENLPNSCKSRNGSNNMRILHDDGCCNVQGITQIKAELPLTEYAGTVHAIYIVCIPDVTTEKWITSKRLREHTSADLIVTGRTGGVCVLLVPATGNLGSFEAVTRILDSSNLQCDSSTRFPNWVAYVYKRKPVVHDVRCERAKVNAIEPSTSLNDELVFFMKQSKTILDSLGAENGL